MPTHHPPLITHSREKMIPCDEKRLSVVIKMLLTITKTARQELEALENKYNQQLKEKGEAQTATELRNEVLYALQDWMSDFIAIAKIALEDKSQLLEMLGIVKSN